MAKFSNKFLSESVLFLPPTYGSISRPYLFKFFKGCFSQNYTWSILEYLDPYTVCKVVPYKQC